MRLFIILADAAYFSKNPTVQVEGSLVQVRGLECCLGHQIYFMILYNITATQGTSPLVR